MQSFAMTGSRCFFSTFRDAETPQAAKLRGTFLGQDNAPRLVLGLTETDADDHDSVEYNNPIAHMDRTGLRAVGRLPARAFAGNRQVGSSHFSAAAELHDS